MESIYFGLLLLVGVAIAGDVDFRACASSYQASITRFAVSDCPDGSSHCTFVKGQNYHFDIAGFAHFGAPTINQLHYKVVATILGFDMVLLEGDACLNMTAPYECPITPGGQIEWSVDRVISSSAPAVNDIPVFARIWANTAGNNDQALGCASINVSIVNGAIRKKIVPFASVRRVE